MKRYKRKNNHAIFLKVAFYKHHLTMFLAGWLMYVLYISIFLVLLTFPMLMGSQLGAFSP